MVGFRKSPFPRGNGLSILKYLSLLTIVGLYWVITGFELLYSTGISGTTQKTGGSGCSCHAPGLPSPEVRLWVDGPSSVRVGGTNEYRLLMTGGPAVKGGFDLAAGRGSLGVTDPMTQDLFGELTHTEAKSFTNDTVSWTFSYSAPPDTGTDTLFSVGNSVNGDFIPPGDQFNFGELFIIDIFSDSLTTVEEISLPELFILEQNYPNPFNPSTRLRYRLSSGAALSLRVYDLTGRSVATLVMGRKGPGSHETQWDASDQPAGLYFARLRVDGEERILKMLLIR